MRIVSLLPAATEIVAALGRLDDLVGVSHECNFPDAVNQKPRVTGCEIHGNAISSHDIDQWVSEQLSQGEDLFTLNETKLRELQPELILTQRLCDVCAPAYGSVKALAQSLPGPPSVLNLEPSKLEDIFDNIGLVADTLEISSVGNLVIQNLRDRVAAVQGKVATARHRPRVAVIEWLDPVFCSGHWTPELVEIAGGEEVFGKKWEDSVRRMWGDVLKSEPEILVIACCGQDVERTLEDWMPLQQRPEVQAIPAVRNGRVCIVEGNAYFSRPGPRVIDTLEILAQILHPDLFPSTHPVCWLGTPPAPRTL